MYNIGNNFFLLTGFVLPLRLIRLLEEIMSEKENKTIIFVETKRRCDDLTRRMRRDGCVLKLYRLTVTTVVLTVQL